MRSSGTSAMPVASSTRRRTSTTRRRTSSAVAPASAWKKLACFGETTAPPTRRPLSPSESMSRPAESPGGLANTEPALEPPGLVLPAPADDRGDLGLGRGRVAVDHPERGPGDHLGGREGRAAVAEPERVEGRGRSGTPPAARSTTSASTSTSAVSRPWPPAFMRTAPPTLPGIPTKNSSPVRPAAAARRASTGSATAAPARTVGRDRRRGRRRRTRRRAPGRARRTRRRRRAGWSPGRRRGAAARSPSASAVNASERRELGPRADPRQDRDRATDVVGGEVGDGDVTLDAHAGRGEARREGVGVHGRGANHSSGAVVRSPAPSVSTTSPGRARRGTCATRSARRGR